MSDLSKSRITKQTHDIPFLILLYLILLYFKETLQVDIWKHPHNKKKASLLIYIAKNAYAIKTPRVVAPPLIYGVEYIIISISPTVQLQRDNYVCLPHCPCLTHCEASPRSLPVSSSMHQAPSGRGHLRNIFLTW